MIRYLIAFLLFAGSAYAQSIGANGNPGIGGNVGSGSTTGASLTGNNTFTGINTFNNTVNTNGDIIGTITADTSTLPSLNQPWIFTSNLTSTVPTNIIYGSFESQIFVSGTAQMSGEINLIHAYGQTNTGSNVSGLENIESNWVNYGTMSGSGAYNNMLVRFQNQTTGVVSETGGANLIQLLLGNYNTTAGAINGFTYILISAPDFTGGGSAPGATYGLLIKDPAASIVTEGQVNIGAAGEPSANVWLTINDTSGNSGHNLILLNTANGNNPLIINAANDVFFSAFNNLGAAATNGFVYMPAFSATPTSMCYFSNFSPCFTWNKSTHTLLIGDNNIWYYFTATGTGPH